MRTQEPRRAPKWLPSLVALVAVILLVAGGVAMFGNLGGGSGGVAAQSDQPSPAPSEADGQSGAEPTTEAQSGDAVPTPTQSDSTPAPSAGADSTRTVIVPSVASAEYSAGSGISARALVPGVVDLHGTCTLTATQGETIREVTGQAMSSADSMSCARDLTIPDDELTVGTWNVAVSYDSDAYTGTSAPVTVQVVK